MQIADLAGLHCVVNRFVAGIEATHEAELDRRRRPADRRRATVHPSRG